MPANVQDALGARNTSGQAYYPDSNTTQQVQCRSFDVRGRRWQN